MRCTGECCARFTLSAGGRFFARVEDVDDPRLRQLVTVVDVVPAEHDAPTFAWFTCRALDASSRRCTVYAARPEACRAYPENDEDGCRFCGAVSHDDAVSDG